MACTQVILNFDQKQTVASWLFLSCLCIPFLLWLATVWTCLLELSGSHGGWKAPVPQSLTGSCLVSEGTRTKQFKSVISLRSYGKARKNFLANLIQIRKQGSSLGPLRIKIKKKKRLFLNIYEIIKLVLKCHLKMYLIDKEQGIVYTPSPNPICPAL